MKILVSNDDGVLAAGIRILATELATVAEIEVVAPDRNRSGASNSLTLTHPIKLNNWRMDIIALRVLLLIVFI